MSKAPKVTPAVELRTLKVAVKYLSKRLDRVEKILSKLSAKPVKRAKRAKKA